MFVLYIYDHSVVNFVGTAGLIFAATAVVDIFLLQLEECPEVFKKIESEEVPPPQQVLAEGKMEAERIGSSVVIELATLTAGSAPQGRRGSSPGEAERAASTPASGREARGQEVVSANKQFSGRRDYTTDRPKTEKRFLPKTTILAGPGAGEPGPSWKYVVRINMLCTVWAGQLVDRVSPVSGEGGLEFVNELGGMRESGNEFRSHGRLPTVILTT